MAHIYRIGEQDPVYGGEITTQDYADGVNLQQMETSHPDWCDRIRSGEIQTNQAVVILTAEGYSRELISRFLVSCQPRGEELVAPQVDKPILLKRVQTLCSQYRQGAMDEQHYRDALVLAGVEGKDVDGYVRACKVLQQGAADQTPQAPANPALPSVRPTPIVDDRVSVLPPDMPPVNNFNTATSPIATVPGVGAIVNQPSSCPELDQCHQVTTAVSELTTAIGKALIDQVRTLINEAINPIVNVQNVMIGKLVNNLDTCQNNLNTCYSKVMKPIQQGLGQCYGNLSCCGCPYPSPEQVVYGLQSQNYMQSVGLYPPGEQPPKPPQQQTQAQYEAPIEVVVNVGQQSGVMATETIEPVSQPTIVTNYYPQLLATSIQSTTPEEPYPVAQYEVKIEESPITVEQNVTIPQAPPQKTPIPPKAGNPPHLDEIGKWFQIPAWDQPQVCEFLDQEFEAVTAGKLTKFVRKGDQRYAPKWWMELWGDLKDPSWIKKWSEVVAWEFIHGAVDITDDMVKFFADKLRCKSIPVDALIMKIAAGFISHWTNGALDGLFRGYEYKIAEQCPQEIPSQADVDNLRLADQIDYQQWECWTKANNQLVNPALKNLYAKREHIAFADALKMYRLGRMDFDTYMRWAKANGYIDHADIIAAETVAIDIPSVSDIIRMMVRDVADPEVVKQYKLDDSFDKKWTGALRKFGESQGIDPEIAKLHWEAHWEYPSSNQAFEMLHRLRPDSPYAKRLNDELSQKYAEQGKQFPGIFTSAGDVQQLLEINDLAWYWRERFAAISYRPLTRTDAQRAHQIDAIDTETLYGVFQDEGYAPENAKILTDFAVKQKQERLARKSYPKGATQAVKMYVSGLWTVDQLLNELNRLKVSGEQRTIIVEQAKHDREVKVYSNAVVCIQKSYAQGAIDDTQAKSALVQIGMDAQLANDNVENLWCKRKGPTRQVTAAKLCEWREKKLIDAEQHMRRLVNLGYPVADAKIIVEECDIDVSKRGWDRLLRELKKQQADLEKAKNAAEKAEKAAERKQKTSDRNGVPH